MSQLFEYIKYFAILALVLMGVGGLSYRTFRDDGWFSTFLGKLWEAFIHYPLVMIPLAIALFVVGKFWNDHQVASGHKSKLPNLFLYCVMAAGAYFTWHFLTEGTF